MSEQLIQRLNYPVRWSEKDFRNLATIIKEETGISLPSSKNTLMETRLQSFIQDLTAGDVPGFILRVANDQSIRQACIEKLTTHKTDWFREPIHFDWLSHHLPEMLSVSQGKISIWSAACSSGEEIVSLATELVMNKVNPHQMRLLATDISIPVLKKTESLIKNKKIPKEVFLRHQGLQTDLAARQRLSETLSHSIKVRQFNLLKSSLPTGLKFNVIFLRNVLIYFDTPTAEEIVSRLRQWLVPGGYLILGLSESIEGKRTGFNSLGKSIYKRT